VDRRAYQGWEAGQHGITWENLDRLAEVLDASADWLRLGDEGMQAIADEQRRGPQPGITRVAAGVSELQQLLTDPPSESSAFLVETLRDIQGRLERIEAALSPVMPSAGGPPPAPGGELGRRLQEPQPTEQDPPAPGSARGRGARRDSGR
jgi:transcriptional regulator with XRE-family HTH domain